MEDVAIRVNGVGKTFRLPHEKRSSVKSAFVSLFRRQTFETQTVLKNASFDIKKGEFFGVVGRNGSGKSTLLKLLAGIYTPTTGSITTNGSLTPFIELGVGFNPELSGRENVFLNGALLGFSRKEMSKIYPQIVKFAELEKFMDQKLKNYSSGMQVRLAFSIAIQAQGDILLIDEVLAVGDAAFQQKCFDYFEGLKARKQTVVFVSHDMGAVRRFCTRAVYIDAGKIVKEGVPADIADLYAESNIKSQEEELSAVLNLSDSHKVSSKISKHDDKAVTLEIAYKTKPGDKTYVGISVLKDSASIAEISTSSQRPLSGSGKVQYILPKNLFNAGTYQIGGISLFRLENRELLAIDKTKSDFVVKGEDLTRGSALKLPDGWVYEKN